MIVLNFYNKYHSDFAQYEAIYNSLAQQCLKILKLDAEYEMSVTLVDNDVIQQMNNEHRNKNYATDVISFENGITDLFDGIDDLGDIFISVDKAKEQALEYQHSLTREMSFLFVHGLLHCLGYDHESRDEEEEMFRLQEVILDALKQKDL